MFSYIHDRLYIHIERYYNIPRFYGVEITDRKNFNSLNCPVMIWNKLCGKISKQQNIAPLTLGVVADNDSGS